MDLGISWTITKKDFSTFRKHKYIIYTLVLVPLLISILLPTVMWYVLQRGGPQSLIVPQLLDAFSFIFVILPGIIPATIGSYSIVGEKVEKSLEPLLATPITDGELLLGKAIAGFLPTLLSTWGDCGIHDPTGRDNLQSGLRLSVFSELERRNRSIACRSTRVRSERWSERSHLFQN